MSYLSKIAKDLPDYNFITNEKITKMKQLTKDQDPIGKTIKKVVEQENNLVIFFEDNTFCVYYATDYNASVYFLESELDINPNLNNFRSLYEMGIIDNNTFNIYYKKEIDEKEEKRIRRYDEQKTNEELRKEIEELKAIIRLKAK